MEISSRTRLGRWFALDAARLVELQTSPAPTTAESSDQITVPSGRPSLAPSGATTRLLLFILLATTAAWMFWCAVYQVDDAYIVYRYARNLAQGHGFVFNPGERVEGVTCFLWTIFLAPFARLGSDLPVLTPILTAVCGLGLVALVAFRHADLEGRRQVSLRDMAPSILLAASPAFVCWSVGALETVPFALVLALAARAHTMETRIGRGHRSALWLGIASMLRPETPVVIAALGLHRWWVGRSWPVSAQVQQLGAWLARIALFYVPFIVFRRWYFGDWLPNTFYAKVGLPATQLVFQGLTYVRTFAASLLFGPAGLNTIVQIMGVICVLFVIAYGFISRVAIVESLLVVAILVATVLDGGDWMPLYRFVVPALPALAILTAHALYRLASRNRAAAVASALVALALVGNGVFTMIAARNGGQGLAVMANGYADAHMQIGDLLNSEASAGDSAALMDVGIVGWYAPNLRVIDITGLTDREIAHAPGGFLDKRFETSQLLARKPRFVVLVPGFSADERIVRDASFQAAYRFRFRKNARASWKPPGEYYLHVFERI